MVYENGKSGMTCAEFDARLSDALDGVLSGSELEQFRAHVEACLECGPVYEQASRGMTLLKSLEEVTPPANLLHNILAQTSMREQRGTSAIQKKPNWARRVADFISPSLAPNVVPVFRGMMQPRFAMTAAMTFFSISMLLNVAGVKVKDLKRLDLRPNAIATSASLQYHETTSKMIKYYENIRFVYEWESRLKAIKSSSSDEDRNQKQQKRPADDNSSEQRKNREEKDVNYSVQQAANLLAMNLINAPVSVPEATERR